MSDRFEEYRRTKSVSEKRVMPFIIITVLTISAVIVWGFALPDLIKHVKYSRQVNSALKVSMNLNLKPDELLISFIDVGQGDCVLIETPNGKKILIDGGEGLNPDNKFIRKMNAGKTIIAPFLKARGIDTLDVVLATHPHSDHIGGLLYILQHFKVLEFLDSGYKTTSLSYKKIVQTVKKMNINYKIPNTGDILNWGEDIFAQVLYRDENPFNINDASIVIFLKYGKRKFIFTGDAEKEVEYKMSVKYGHNINSDLYYVGHHGSKTSSTEIFLKCIQPKISVFSVGSYNPFGHPAKEIIDRIKKFGCSRIYRTDENGNILVITDGDNLRIKTFHN